MTVLTVLTVESALGIWPTKNEVESLAVRRIPIGEAHAVTANVVARREEMVFALDKIGLRELGQPPVLRLQCRVVDGARDGIAIGRRVD